MFTNCSPNFVLLEGCNTECDLLCFVYLTIRFLLCSKSCNRLINIIQIFIVSLLNTKLQYCLIATHYAWNFKGTAPVEFGEILEIFDSLRLLHTALQNGLKFFISTCRTRIYTNILAILFSSISSSIIQ